MILPPPLRDHVPASRLAEEEDRLEVGVDHRVPILFGEVDRVGAADDAGIVDQDVEPPELLDRRAYDTVCTGSMVERSADTISARRPSARALATVSSAGVRPTRGDVGPGPGERQRDRLADAGVGAGDDGDKLAG